MIQCQLKLKLRPAQERMLGRWLWHLTGVYNWTVKKIRLDADDNIYRSKYGFDALLRGHSVKMGIPVEVLRSTVRTAHDAWSRCFAGAAGRPRLKGRRNRLNSFHFLDPIRRPVGCRIRLAGIGPVKFHHQEIREGAIKCSRIVRRASGWYLCLFIEAEPNEIPHVADGSVGIDPGFASLVTLSTGEKVEHPHELRLTEERLAQAQRGQRRQLTARLQERSRNQRKDRNHKLSRRLVAENAVIAWSKDSHLAIARNFGKSVAGAAHGQLRQMLAYKCRSGGRQFIEVSNRYSTVTCSACGARSGPTGYAGLSVRSWTCGCGAAHDRDGNAAINTLNIGLGLSLERGRETAAGIAYQQDGKGHRRGHEPA